MENQEDQIDWQDRINQIEPLLKRDNIDFSTNRYVEDLLKIMFWVYNYGKGYPRVDDEWYAEEFTSDILNTDYKGLAEPEFCIEVFRLFKKVPITEYAFNSFSDFFISNAMDSLNNLKKEYSSMSYDDFKNIIINEDLLNVKGIDELNIILDRAEKY